MAVITEVPALPKSKLDPEIATTEVVSDAYDHVPATEPPTVGATIAASASPKTAEIFDQVNVGVA